MPREKPRYFTHSSGRFGDDTAYIVSKPTSGHLVMRNGEKHDPTSIWKLEYSLGSVAAGMWKEISCHEARALVARS